MARRRRVRLRLRSRLHLHCNLNMSRMVRIVRLPLCMPSAQVSVVVIRVIRIIRNVSISTSRIILSIGIARACCCIGIGRSMRITTSFGSTGSTTRLGYARRYRY